MNLQCKHMLSASSLRLKNNWGTHQKWWGKIWKSIESCWKLTLEHDTLCFVLGWDVLLYIIDLLGFGLFIFSFHLMSTMSLWPPIPWIQKLPKWIQLCRWYVQELSFYNYTYLWFYVSSKIILHPFVSCRWCGIHYGLPSTWSLPINFNSLSGKLTERLPSSTLELACPNGKFFTLDDKFT